MLGKYSNAGHIVFGSNLKVEYSLLRSSRYEHAPIRAGVSIRGWEADEPGAEWASDRTRSGDIARAGMDGAGACVHT